MSQRTENLQSWELVLLARRRQTALNVLKNHFDEAAKLNLHLPRFQKNAKAPALRVEDFLFEAASSKTLLLHSKAVKHFKKIVESWPTGTVAWEHLPPERNPYFRGQCFASWKAPTHEQLCVKELLSEHHDLVLMTFLQGRKAALLSLSPEDCETTDEVLRAIWTLGFEKGEMELAEKTKPAAQPQEREKQQ